MNKPMMVADFHGCLTSPHCSASSKQHTAPIRRSVPTGSIRLSLAGSDSLRSESSRLFNLRKIKIRIHTTTPMGRLLCHPSSACVAPDGQTVKRSYIQKHHLQLARSVRTPPTMGPKHTAMPKTLTTMPR